MKQKVFADTNVMVDQPIVFHFTKPPCACFLLLTEASVQL